MGLINLNGQRTCLLEMLCNARVPVPSQKSVSVTGQVLMLICTNRWIVMDERETFLILKITIGSGLIYVPLYFDPRTVTIKFTCSYFLLPSQFRSITNQEDTKKKENSKDTHSLSRSRTQLPRPHIVTGALLTNILTELFDASQSPAGTANMTVTC